MNGHFVFADPHLLWLLLLIPLLALLRGRRGKTAAVLYSSTRILGIVARRRRQSAGALLASLRFLILALAIVALARPQLSSSHRHVEAEGIDIILAIDVSLSMIGLDFMVNNRRMTRLEAVKQVIADFIDQRPDDRIGMVAFAGEAYLVSPLTLNHDWLHKNLERVEIGIVREQGTAIGSALAVSVNRLRDLEDSPSRVVVLLTDGANNAGQISPMAAAEAAAAFGIRVYTIAAGSENRVLVPRLGRNYEVIRDSNGDPVPQGYADFPIDEETLERMASLTGGRAFRAYDTETLSRIYREIDQLERTEVRLQQYAVYRELFAWPLSLAFLLFALEQILGQSLLRRLP